MSGTPTPKQALVLWCLLGRGGSALQSALAPRVDPKDRDALVAGRFIEAARQGRSMLLSVTDAGWDWAGRHRREPLPPTFRVLQDWLERIDDDLARSGRTLADLIGPPDDAPAPPPPKPPRAPRKSPAKSATAGAISAKTDAKVALNGAKGAKAIAKGAKPPAKGGRSPAKGAVPPGHEAVRARIEAAYLTLTGGRKAEAVRLSALRAALGDLDRATVDAALGAILRGDPTARLSQFSDPKSLDAAEREATFSPAGEPYHLIRIQS